MVDNVCRDCLDRNLKKIEILVDKMMEMSSDKQFCYNEILECLSKINSHLDEREHDFLNNNLDKEE